VQIFLLGANRFERALGGKMSKQILDGLQRRRESCISNGSGANQLPACLKPNAIAALSQSFFLTVFLAILLPSYRTLAQQTLSSSMPLYGNILEDWKDQDGVNGGYRSAITGIIATLPPADKTSMQSKLNALSGSDDNSSEMEDLYVQVCSARRAQRMANYIAKFPKVVFSQRGLIGPVYFVDQNTLGGGENGKGLQLLTMNGYYGSGVTQLMPNGAGRDPCVSFDGKRVLFAWREESNTSERPYHIYEMNLETREKRQITSGPDDKFHVDLEPCYLPNGNIIFTSTRYVQEIDCVDGRVTNLMLCDSLGRYMRQIGFDQAPVVYPTVISSGEVVYARWDYNDKSHTYAHALFIMNPDGTAQREFCNNNSWWPTNILQQRGIPGTMKVMAMIGGYHSSQWGKIGIIDIQKGTQNGKGITLVAPVRLPENDDLDEWGDPNGGPYHWRAQDAAVFPKKGSAPLDWWGQRPPMFAYPFPFDETAFLCSFKPEFKNGDWGGRMALYFMTIDGKRELLYYDPDGSCMSAVPVVPRDVLEPNPIPVLANRVNYSDSTGEFQMINVNETQSPLLDGVAPGTIKRIRVVSLYYRPGPPVDGNSYIHCGPGDINYGGATYHSRIATTNASWDAKWVIGETPVESDGSAAFTVPARTPVFFQALDAQGHVVQTMRSWATLQPGETFACVGCHESRLKSTPMPSTPPIALQRGALPLEPFYGPWRGFSFKREIQPILNAKCTGCHNGSQDPDLRDGQAYDRLTDHGECESSSRYVSWFHAEDSPILQPPYRVGSSLSLLTKKIESGEMPKNGMKLSKEEIDKINCWIDIGVPQYATYEEAHPGSEGYLVHREAWQAEEKKNIEEYIRDHPEQNVSSVNFTRWAILEPRMGMIGSRQAWFEIPSGVNGQVLVRLFDLRGGLVRTLAAGSMAPGSHSVDIHGSGRGALAPGRYILRMNVKGIDKSAAVLIGRM
jgi:hypothetical protein